jgi:hypothetical protein
MACNWKTLQEELGTKVRLKSASSTPTSTKPNRCYYDHLHEKAASDVTDGPSPTSTIHEVASAF